MRALETRVGAALFIRTTRSVGLTEASERFLSRAKPAFEELVAASEVARDLGQRPAGLLRLSVPRAVVPILLEPLIASFCQAYPEVEVEIAASEELVDLAAEGFDAGIRLGQFIAPDMIDAAVPVRGRWQPRLSAQAEAAGAHRRSASAPCTQRALSAWSTFGSATRICGAFATLVRNHPNWIVVLGEKNHFGSFVRELWRPQTPSFMRIE